MQFFSFKVFFFFTTSLFSFLFNNRVPFSFANHKTIEQQGLTKSVRVAGYRRKGSRTKDMVAQPFRKFYKVISQISGSKLLRYNELYFLEICLWSCSYRYRLLVRLLQLQNLLSYVLEDVQPWYICPKNSKISFWEWRCGCTDLEKQCPSEHRLHLLFSEGGRRP